MRTATIEIYTIDELAESAQKSAHENYLSSNFEYVWVDEMIDTLNAFADIFPVKITNYNFSSYSVDIRYRLERESCPEERAIYELSGHRLATYLWNNYGRTLYKGKYYSKGRTIDGKWSHVSRHSKIVLESRNCHLTGVCFDESILDPIYNFIDKPDGTVNFEYLLNDCIQSFSIDCRKDLEYQESFEYFFETAQANNWEFLESGEFY